MIDSIELLGFFATFLSSIASVPQAVRIIRTKDADAVSTQTYVILSISYISWMIYAYHTDALPLFAASLIMLITAMLILGLKFDFWIKRRYPKFMLYSNT